MKFSTIPLPLLLLPLLLHQPTLTSAAVLDIAGGRKPGSWPQRTQCAFYTDEFCTKKNKVFDFDPRSQSFHNKRYTASTTTHFVRCKSVQVPIAEIYKLHMCLTEDCIEEFGGVLKSYEIRGDNFLDKRRGGRPEDQSDEMRRKGCFEIQAPLFWWWIEMPATGDRDGDYTGGDHYHHVNDFR